MSNYSLPPVERLSDLPAAEFTQALDALFEPCETLHRLVEETSIKANHYGSYDEFIGSVGKQLYYLMEEEAPAGSLAKLDTILGAHPRLGAKKVESAQSQAEQAQLNNGGKEEAERLAALNKEYEQTFPGLRYVVFVNGRSRPVIMENMRARIDRDEIMFEREEAIKVFLIVSLVYSFHLDQCSNMINSIGYV